MASSPNVWKSKGFKRSPRVLRRSGPRKHHRSANTPQHDFENVCGSEQIHLRSLGAATAPPLFTGSSRSSRGASNPRLHAPATTRIKTKTETSGRHHQRSAKKSSMKGLSTGLVSSHDESCCANLQFHGTVQTAADVCAGSTLEASLLGTQRGAGA